MTMYLHRLACQQTSNGDDGSSTTDNKGRLLIPSASCIRLIATQAHINLPRGKLGTSQVLASVLGTRLALHHQMPLTAVMPNA